MLSVAIAGPLSNLLLAVIGAAGMKLLASSLTQFNPGYLTVMLSATLLQTFVTINLSLAIFNLLPIPPLDGSRVVSFFLPERYRRQYRQFEEMAPIVLMLLFALGGLSLILSPLMQMSFSALLGLFDNPLREISIYLLQLKSAGIQL